MIYVSASRATSSKLSLLIYLGASFYYKFDVLGCDLRPSSPAALNLEHADGESAESEIYFWLVHSRRKLLD